MRGYHWFELVGGPQDGEVVKLREMPIYVQMPDMSKYRVIPCWDSNRHKATYFD